MSDRTFSRSARAPTPAASRSAVLIGQIVYDVFDERPKGRRGFRKRWRVRARCAVRMILLRDGLVSRCRKLSEILDEEPRSQLANQWHECGGKHRGLEVCRSVDFDQLKEECGEPVAKVVSLQAFSSAWPSISRRHFAVSSVRDDREIDLDIARLAGTWCDVCGLKGCR